MINFKLPYNKIFVSFTKTKDEYLLDNSKYLKIGINTRQAGYIPLYNGQDITLFFDNTTNTLSGKFYKDKHNENYILVNSLSELNFNFDTSSIVYYLESTSVNNKSNGLTTLSDVKSLKPELNTDSNFQGLSGLLDSETYSLINKVDSEILIHQSTVGVYKSVNNNTYPLLNYVVDIDNKEYQFIFAVRCQHFSVEYIVSIFGDKISVKTLQFDNLNEYSKDLEVQINIGRIVSINNDKYSFNVDLALKNLSSTILDNTPLYVYVKTIKSEESNFYKDLQSNFIVTNKTQLLNTDFNKYVLFADKVHTVKLEGSRIINLSGSDNIDVIYEPGNYFLLNQNLSSQDIFEGLPKQENNLPYITSFSLNVKEFLPNIVIQTVEFIYDNKIHRYERTIETGSKIVGPWKYNYDSISKIPANDIVTTTDKQFVSQTQIDNWNRIENVINNNYFKPMVIEKGDLPTPGEKHGEIRFVKNENCLYSWDSFNEIWIAVNDDKLSITEENDNLIVRLFPNDTGIVIPKLTEDNMGILTPEIIKSYKSDFINNLNFTVTGDKYLVGNYRKPSDSPFHICKLSGDTIKFKDRLINIIPNFNNTGNNFNVDLRDNNFFDNIESSTFSHYNDRNIFTSQITEYEFVILGALDINILFLFDENTYTTINRNGVTSTDKVSNFLFQNGILNVKFTLTRGQGGIVESKNLHLDYFILS